MRFLPFDLARSTSTSSATVHRGAIEKSLRELEAASPDETHRAGTPQSQRAALKLTLDCLDRAHTTQLPVLTPNKLRGFYAEIRKNPAALVQALCTDGSGEAIAAFDFLTRDGPASAILEAHAYCTKHLEVASAAPRDRDASDRWYDARSRVLSAALRRILTTTNIADVQPLLSAIADGKLAIIHALHRVVRERPPVRFVGDALATALVEPMRARLAGSSPGSVDDVGLFVQTLAYCRSTVGDAFLAECAEQVAATLDVEKSGWVGPIVDGAALHAARCDDVDACNRVVVALGTFASRAIAAERPDTLMHVILSMGFLAERLPEARQGALRAQLTTLASAFATMPEANWAKNSWHPATHFAFAKALAAIGENASAVQHANSALFSTVDVVTMAGSLELMRILGDVEGLKDIDPQQLYMVLDEVGRAIEARRGGEDVSGGRAALASLENAVEKILPSLRES